MTGPKNNPAEKAADREIVIARELAARFFDDH